MDVIGTPSFARGFSFSFGSEAMATAITDYAAEREAMVARHLRRRGITEQPIIDAFLAVPREEFVAPDYAILAAASGSHVPQPWIDQLAHGGRIVMPVGDPGWVQELIKVTKGPNGKLIQESLGGVRFVPLIGEEGWKDA